MRLLRLSEDDNFVATEFIGEDIPSFGILSHTWGADHDEVSLKDLLEGTAARKVSGHEKLRFCAKQTASDGLVWFWVDTCSIDKTSSAELSEAINSMYQWYKSSTKCYVYLSDVSADENAISHRETWEVSFRKSRWFTRGWTLQELLAPNSVEFFSKEGVRLGDKSTLGQVIHEITSISLRALQGTLLYDFSPTERLSWAAGRKTRRPEDMAYSLLGIFDVNMPLIYGEGRQKAMTRLYRELRESLPGEPLRSLNSHFQSLGLGPSLGIDTALGEQIDTQQTQEDGGDDEDLFAYTPCSPLDSSPISAAASSQTEIDVFVLGEDRTLKHMRLLNDKPTTSNWQSDGKWFADAPVVVSRSRSRIEVVATTPYGKVLYQETRTGLLLKEYWQSLGGIVTNPLTAASWAPNRLDLFGLGPQGQVLHKFSVNGKWFPSQEAWRDLGGSFRLPPLAVPAVPGRIDLLCVNEHQSSLHHKWYDRLTWHPGEDVWADRGKVFMSPPAAVTIDRNRLVMIILGLDGDLYHGQVRNNNWDVWWIRIYPPGGGTFISRPAVVVSNPRQIDIFCLRSDNQIYRRRDDVDEDNWEKHHEWVLLGGGHFVSAPFALCSRLKQVYVFCKGIDDEIYFWNVDDDAQTEWKSIGYPD
jgi:hypothetical protein